MKPRRTLQFTTPTMDNLVDWLQRHGRVLDGNVSFGQTNVNKTNRDRNIDSFMANGATPGVANTEFSVTHSLGRIPITFFGHTDNGGVLYKSTTAWSKTAVFLKCTTVTANYQVVLI